MFDGRCYHCRDAIKIDGFGICSQNRIDPSLDSSEVSATAASHCTMHIQCIVALRVKRLKYLRTAGVKELFDFIPRTFGVSYYVVNL